MTTSELFAEVRKTADAGLSPRRDAAMPPKYRLAAVKEAPVYHPTPDEFSDPLRYIASIRAEAEAFGLCRIVPPEGWSVPFNQDTATFSFKTRIQTVNELQLRLKKGKNRSFRTEYADFMQSQGQSVTRWPVFGGKKLDLQALYDCVTSRGGFDAACRAKQWRDIARTIDAAGAGTSAAFALRQLYQKWLLAFEKHKKHLETLSPAGKAKEAAATKKEREEERKREKAEARAAAERAAAEQEEATAKEEDVLEALFELGNATEPAPKRLKLEMVRPRSPVRSELFLHLALQGDVSSFFLSKATRGAPDEANDAILRARVAAGYRRTEHCRRSRRVRVARIPRAYSPPARASPAPSAD